LLDSAALPWRLQAEHAGGGLFLDLASHTLDILDFFLGPLQDVDGRAANLASPYDVEDRVVLQFRTGAGALGTGSWNFASHVNEDVTVVTGTDGELRLSTFGAEPVELHTAGEGEQFDLPNPPHIQQPLIQTVVDALHGRGACPSTGVSAARTSQVMDRVLASYYGSRESGFWRHPELWPGRRPGR
jgi:predicted dehydrogenase